MPSIKLFFSLLVLAAVFYACSDDDMPPPDSNNVDVILNFSAVQNESEIGISERFINGHGYAVEVMDLNFYISNIAISKGDESLLLSEIELIKIREGRTSMSFSIPNVGYDKIAFDLGVPVHLNGTTNPDFIISIFDPEHPLSESNGMYWTWQTGYRFCVLEGRYDTLPNTDTNLQMLFAFHSGRDTLFRSVHPFPIETQHLIDGKKLELNFGVDLDKMFISQTDTIDLKYENSFHGSLGNLDLGIKFANNSSAAFKLLAP